MDKLEPRIHDEANGLDYILVGDYYIPAIGLLEDDNCTVGKWGRMHKEYLEKIIFARAWQEQMFGL